jgi:TetR/AcrR family transcriptional regulator, regulator of cefoperazone and chloramphenicol sensitivity
MTARARIRDVALDLFATRGYAGTSIRDVAREASVSPGLVQHHFGNKKGLREACDAHVLSVLQVSVDQKASRLERSDWDRDFVSALYEATGPTVRYVARGLAEGWPGAAEAFDLGVEGTARCLTKIWPDRYPAGADATTRHAAVMTAMSLGIIVLHGHLARWLGVDPVERGQQHATGAAQIEIYLRMAEFFQSESGRSLRKAFIDYERELESSGKRDGDE